MAKNIKSVIRGYSRQKEEEQAKLIALEINLPYINLVNYPFTGDVLGLIDADNAKKFQIVAFQQLGNNVRVATPYPFKKGLAELMNELGVRRNVSFTPYYCSLTSIEYALKQYDKLVRDTTQTEADATRESVEEFLKNISSLKDFSGAIQNVSTTKLLETILSGALAFNASDIHFEPQATSIRLRFRIDGELIDVTTISNESYHLLVSRIKNLSGLKLNRLSTAQDGRFSINVAADKIDVRVNVLPATYGETAELRILSGKGLMTLDSLGLNPEVSAAIDRNISKETGLIIITGPTGSGKTTTLYGILQILNKPETKIITIEDPVEYKIPGIEQIQVNPDKGFDFADALKAVLRQDPDVILVGEIRDKETAEIAINASLTGHLVLSTLHTNNAPATFARLIEMGAPAHLLADAISLIIAQRLVKKVGGGRIAIAEFLEPNAEFAELIKNKASVRELTELFAKLGNKDLEQDLAVKHEQGLV